MIREYDCAIYGGGPTGLSVMEKCGLDSSNGKVAFLHEINGPIGAYAKGVKSVNPIVPKLPRINSAKADMYDYITRRAADSEKALLREYANTYPFTGKSETSFRVVERQAELELLNNLSAIKQKTDISLSKATADFAGGMLGSPLDATQLFTYRERIWDLKSYDRLMRRKLAGLPIEFVQRVSFIEENNGLLLEIVDAAGDKTYLKTKKLVVCRGIGNINFENHVANKLSATAGHFNFGVLDLCKFIYQDVPAMPDGVSSIMMPQQKICITNEALGRHSILFNTAANLQSTAGFDPGCLDSGLAAINEQMRTLHPALPAGYAQALRCAMTLNEAAFTNQPDLHFEFLISPSAVDHIHYVNLPYFTVIRMAMASLPSQIIDFK
jgi:hypothetical protein